MLVKITYPEVTKCALHQRKLIHILRWPAGLAVYICPIVNIATGGVAWSLLVLFGIYLLWRFLLATDLVEYNRISQSSKLTLALCGAVGLVDILFSLNIALFVMPMLCFTGLCIASILFFTDLQKQKQNMLPMLFFLFICLIAGLLGVFLYKANFAWIYTLLFTTSVGLLLSFIVLLGEDFLLEFKRRFHTR